MRSSGSVMSYGPKGFLLLQDEPQRRPYVIHRAGRTIRLGVGRREACGLEQQGS